MNVNLPANVRVAIYVTVVMGTAVLVPLNATGVVNDTVLLVWNSVSGAASLLAAFNVKPEERA